MNVLRHLNYDPPEIVVARLSGYDINIDPIATLIRSDACRVYGFISEATHAELEKLYVYAKEIGALYLPEAVLVETLDGTLRPTLCYIAHHMESKTPTNEYINLIAESAKRLSFPKWYRDRIDSFRPQHWHS